MFVEHDIHHCRKSSNLPFVRIAAPLLYAICRPVCSENFGLEESYSGGHELAEEEYLKQSLLNSSCNQFD